ncbi:winged helix-turn-helix domain-containing protein [Streptomyces varsoviensis]|uniref:winged helix-turn-helix domain-containing protein n=1 Tax=Streptomyces varsoviensis TaxID=67373 RepID=UPI000662C2A4|nr:winged helix-turn-helix domain-containing protein [Streptomyces varsoviensis]
MVYRIHFTAEDIARTRLATGPSPLVELALALRALQDASHPVRFDAWRRHARTRLGPRARRLLELNPAAGWSPDIFISVEPASPQDALEAVRAAPAGYLREDLAGWARLQRRVPSWTSRIAEEPALFQGLVDTLADVHAEVIAPYWPHIEQLAHADRGVRLRHLADHGVEGLLSRLSPRHLRWRAPVLEATSALGHSGDIRLDGRGLLLIPSLFRPSHSVVNAWAEPQPWLTFPLHDGDRPALSPARTAAALSGVPHSLSALLGRTRANVLAAIADHPGCTTTELAVRTGVAPASASEHATVLRTAGLTAVARHHNTALHTLTPAGRSLLDASTAVPGRSPGWAPGATPRPGGAVRPPSRRS